MHLVLFACETMKYSILVFLAACSTVPVVFVETTGTVEHNTVEPRQIDSIILV